MTDEDIDSLHELLSALDEQAGQYGWAFGQSDRVDEKQKQAIRWAESLRSLLEDSGPEEDLSDCPFFRNPDGGGVCDRGCWEEPMCQTNEPQGGWPSTRAITPVADVLAGALVEFGMDVTPVDLSAALWRSGLLRRDLLPKDET